MKLYGESMLMLMLMPMPMPIQMQYGNNWRNQHFLTEFDGCSVCDSYMQYEITIRWASPKL